MGKTVKVVRVVLADLLLVAARESDEVGGGSVGRGGGGKGAVEAANPSSSLGEESAMLTFDNALLMQMKLLSFKWWRG